MIQGMLKLFVTKVIISAQMDINLRKFCYVTCSQHIFNQISVFFKRYETSDGISRSEEAEIKNAGTENETLVVRGTISWVAPDGQTYTITFIADENGFQPVGEHLPK